MIFNHQKKNVNEIVQNRINLLKIGQKMQDLPEELWHNSFKYYLKEDKHRKGGPNLRIIRLDPNNPSLTVTGYIFNKFVHPFENRYISVREAARLQGFPDDFEFKGSITSTQQQVGNAVPIQLSEAIFRQIQDFTKEKNKKITAFSLFSGAGGLDLGAYYENIDTKIAIDSWDDACNSLRGYLGKKTKVITIDISEISDPLNFWKEHSESSTIPDLIFGGPPCQAFSQAGKQKSLEDPRGILIYEYIRFIKAIRPKYFVLENVSNIKSVQGGTLYKDIVQKLNNLGYNISDGILCAADYGAPQLRKRAIFIGTDKKIGKIFLPIPTHSAQTNILQLKPYVTVKEAFRNLPKLCD